MAYIRPLANGHFRADVRMKGILKNKTFPSLSLAQAWVDKIEQSIKNIPCLDLRIQLRSAISIIMRLSAQVQRKTPHEVFYSSRSFGDGDSACASRPRPLHPLCYQSGCLWQSTA